MIPGLIEITLKVIKIFQQISIPYMIGGSVASSVYGVPRTTNDADIIVNLSPRHIPSLVNALKDGFYVDAGMIKEAIENEGSFNIIHLETAFKVDVFILKSRPYDQLQFSRRQLETIGEVGERVHLETPEDIILSKLAWYRAGDCVSDAQRRDILGVIKVQADDLDWVYLRKWASRLGLLELLNQIKQEK